MDDVTQELEQALARTPTDASLLVKFVAQVKGAPDAEGLICRAIRNSRLGVFAATPLLLEGLGVRFRAKPEAIDFVSGDFDVVLHHDATDAAGYRSMESVTPDTGWLDATHCEDERLVSYMDPSVRLLLSIVTDASRLEEDLGSVPDAQRLRTYLDELTVAGVEFASPSDPGHTSDFRFQGLEAYATWLRAQLGPARAARKERWDTKSARRWRPPPYRDVIPAGMCGLCWRCPGSRLTLPLREKGHDNRDIYYTPADLVDALSATAKTVSATDPGSSEELVRDLVALLGLPPESFGPQGRFGRSLTVYHVPRSDSPGFYQLSTDLRKALGPPASRLLNLDLVPSESPTPSVLARGERAKGAPVEGGPFQSAPELLAWLCPA